MSARGARHGMQRTRAAIWLAGLALFLPNVGGAQSENAQGTGPGQARAQSSASNAAAIDPQAARHQEVFALPKLFFAPSQRHAREIAEANALSGAVTESERPSSVRFNGWLSGPAKTHTWINGTAQTPGNRVAGEAATFDAETKRLVVTDARGRDVRLRAGESLDQETVITLEMPRATRPAQQVDDAMALRDPSPPAKAERP